MPAKDYRLVRGRHDGGNREANWEATKIDAQKAKKTAPEDGLCLETRGIESGIDPAVPVLDLDETPFFDAATERLSQGIHLSAIPRLFQNGSQPQDL